jgi:hypothetical protein
MMETVSEEIRFGVIAVKRGFVTPDQVVEALARQVKEDLFSGQHRPVGEILLEEGTIDRSQLDQIITEMESPENRK